MHFGIASSASSSFRTYVICMNKVAISALGSFLKGFSLDYISNNTERQSVVLKRDSRASQWRGETRAKGPRRGRGHRVAQCIFFSVHKAEFLGADGRDITRPLSSSSLPLSLFLSLSLSLFSQEETVHREALFHPIQPLCLHRAEVDGPLTQFFKWIADAARVPRVFSSSPHSPPSLSLSLSHPFSS